MTHDLEFSTANIKYTTRDTTREKILWDMDTNTFGAGATYAQALHALADNLDEEYGGDTNE